MRNRWSSSEDRGGSIRIAYRYFSLVREAKVSADMEAILLFRRNLETKTKSIFIQNSDILLSGDLSVVFGIFC